MCLHSIGRVALQRAPVARGEGDSSSHTIRGAASQPAVLGRELHIPGQASNLPKLDV